MRVNWDSKFIYSFCTQNNQLFDDFESKDKTFLPPSFITYSYQTNHKRQEYYFSHISVSFGKLFQHNINGLFYLGPNSTIIFYSYFVNFVDVFRAKKNHLSIGGLLILTAHFIFAAFWLLSCKTPDYNLPQIAMKSRSHKFTLLIKT